MKDVTKVASREFPKKTDTDADKPEKEHAYGHRVLHTSFTHRPQTAW